MSVKIVNNVANNSEQPKLLVETDNFEFSNWTIGYEKSHILHSICTTPEKCKDESQEPCLLCLYTKTLHLPHLPEMVFPSNTLTLSHVCGGVINFNTLDALKTVSDSKLPIKVACSDAWKESRPPDFLEEKIKQFDWTFSCTYKGSLTGNINIEPTNERIDIEKLKVKEKILFYEELTLYEDELHDNGISSCTLKIRVMPSCFFVLLRYFLRVDQVMVKVNDTRYYHEFDKDYVIREYSSRESEVTELNLPLSCFGDPNVLSSHMPIVVNEFEKITFRQDA